MNQLRPIRFVASRPAGRRLPGLLTALALLAFPAIRGWAQTAPAAKDVVTLPTFTITESPANPYVSKQALSASRIAMDIQDIPQSVAVVTGDFLRDSLSNRMLDAAKYITPVTESSLPTGGDRYNMRGFQTSHEFIDGMEISGADGYSMSLAPYNIDRIEIIKGPNAILVPGGAPGGQFNPITKSPIMKDQQSLTLNVSQYVGNDVSVDTNRILSQEKGIAGRTVIAYWNNGGYSDRSFRKGWMFAPSVSWLLSPDHKLVVKAEIMRNKETNGVFIPLDPASMGAHYAQVARGLPRDWSFGNSNDFRDRQTERLTLELQSTLSSHITSRLMVTADHVLREDQGGTNASISGAGGGSINPFTGIYEPGVNWNTAAYNAGSVSAPTATAAPVTDPSSWTFVRSNGSDHLYYSEAHLRNDYAGKFEGNGWTSTTIAGLAANASKVHWKTYANQARPSVPDTAAGLAAITFPDRIYADPATVNNKTGKQTDLQVYAYENAAFFNGMLQLSGGLSRYYGTLTRTDTTGVGAIAQPSFSIDTLAKSYGVLVKPIPNVSVFWSRNDSGESLPGSLSAGGIASSFQPQNGTQDEYGVKSNWLQGRLTASFVYFDIAQTNQQVPNSDWYLDPTKPKDLFLDITSKGWEVEGSYALGQNLTIVGNYSRYKARQALGTRLRGVPDETWGVYAEYRFNEGSLSGFGANIGVDFRSDAAGQNAAGYTTTRPLPNGTLVPNQPNALYDGRTLANVGLSYRARNWTARLQVANVTDEKYIAAVLNTSSIMVGEPRSLRGSFTYSF
ncbi:MAG TPA: TonB-dependent receptor plug domain-containing protein [Lacunisphaera sp.]|jgi:iron complex outermembrane receptor protein|nr:TonB-dependent receptor plug domain-containing protein [Lacunisphaera sp.]